MKRREFLEILGIGILAVAKPKFIFDMGAHLYKPDYSFLEETTFAPRFYPDESLEFPPGHTWIYFKAKAAPQGVLYFE